MQFFAKGRYILTDEDLKKIKYIRIGTSNDYELQLGSESMPQKFIPSDCGDEYDYCCIYNTTSFNSIDDFIDIRKWGNYYSLAFKEEVIENYEDTCDMDCEGIIKESNKFEESLSNYEPYDGSYIKAEYEEDAENETLLNMDDFKYFTELERVKVHGLLY